MGSYEPQILVDEPLCGLPPGSGCLLPLGIAGKEFGDSLGDIGSVSMGLVDQCRNCEGYDNVVFDEHSRLEMACQLVSYNGNETGSSVIEGNSCSEIACPISNCNGDTMSPVDGIYVSSPQTYSVNIVNLSIDQEASIIRKGGLEDGFAHKDFSVAEKAPWDELNVDELSMQIGKDCQSSSLGTEKCFAGEESKCDDAPGNMAENEEISLASSSWTVLLNKQAQHGEDKDTVDVNGSIDEEVTDAQKVVEDNCDVLPRALGGLNTHVSVVEVNTCNLKEGSLDMVSDCSVKHLASLHSCKPAIDNVSSQGLTLPDLQGSDAINRALTCSSVTDCTKHVDNGGEQNDKPDSIVSSPQKGDALSSSLARFSMIGYNVHEDNARPDSVSVSNCSDTKGLVLRRSTRVSKLNRIYETRKAAQQCRNTVNGISRSCGTIGIFLKIARGKRSCPCKPARSSVWGALGNIIQVFKQNDLTLKHDFDLIQLPNHGSQKTRGWQRSKRQKKARAGRNSCVSRGKCRTSTSHVHLKVKMGEEVGQRNLQAMLPEMVVPPASVQIIVSECLPDFDPRVDLGGSKAANMVQMEHKLRQNVPSLRQFQCPSESLEKSIGPVDICVLDAHFADKDLESTVTQDISVGNNVGTGHGVSSQMVGETIKNGYLDVGTSPDSEVTNRIHDAHVSSGVQEDVHAVVSTSSQDVAIPTDVTVSNILVINTKRGKKNIKIKGDSHSQSGYCAEEGTLLGRAKKNKNRKPLKRKPRQTMGQNLDSGGISALETGENASSNSSSIGECATESLLLVGGVEPGIYQETFSVETGIDICPSSGQDVGNKPSESLTSEGSLSAAKTKGRKLSKMFMPNVGASKSRSHVPASSRRRKVNNHEQKGAPKCSKRKAKEKGPLVDKSEIQRQSGTVMDLSSGTRKDSACSGAADLSKINEGNDRSDLGRIKIDDNMAPEDISSSSMVSIGLEEQKVPPRSAWVRCDDCYKWRCIPAALADEIEETNCRWTCKDNADKSFADCSVPQEKSNAEINAELEISDASCEEDAYDAHSNPKGFECRQLIAPQQASWALIKSNLFLHRSRKSQTIDEIMVCHCKPPPDGNLGCGDECLNRMLNIECVQGTCPCGDQCSNQQFQKQKYAKFKWFRCGKKGYGLQLLENVYQGQFLIEYVGEVLDLHAFEARQREYASMGQKHFYFMTLNGSEVIDACAKGNLGRFINHSCDPNCRTEKWMVNGEVCIGLFALRDIKKGEEITFDYNYVRVFGAAAKKCYCGASDCQGYIGGDPSNTDLIVQGDSDEEYPEPIMIDEHGYNTDDNDEIGSSTINRDSEAVQNAEVSLKTRDTLNRAASPIGQLELSLDNKNTTGKSSSAVQSSKVSLAMEDNTGKFLSTVRPLEVSLQTKSTMDKSSSPVQLLEVSLEKGEAMNKSACSQTLDTCYSAASTEKKFIPDSIDDNKSRCDAVEYKRNLSKLHPMKSSRPSSSIKNKNNASPMITTKPQVVGNKPKKLLGTATSGRFEGVEEKLNELLDAEGGISKRKDATKGYLKLLFVTAAAGDSSNGEAFQSTRDLSMILDALLKTKSRTVLTDIINKNGLQMLHNIMKQNRKDFSKIPILRKLLKVLEYLALREILSLEHINRDPPHPGMESFKDSMLDLTKHNDVQVHQIARNFRDRWIPRSLRRVSYTDRDDSKLELQSGSNSIWLSSSHKRWNDQGVRPTEAINCVAQTMLSTTSFDADGQVDRFVSYVSNACPPNGRTTRKRKSRWDQPTETSLDLKPPHSIEEQKVELNLKQKLEPSSLKAQSCDLVGQDEASTTADTSHIQEDAPPGFASVKSPPVRSNAFAATTANLLSDVDHSGFSCEVIMGTAQRRYLSHLPVSYGIPLSFVKQLGTLQAESVDCWKIAPGIPFHPFPPLPPFPRARGNSLSPASIANPMTRNAHEEEFKLSSHHGHHLDPSIPSTSGERPPDVAVSGANNQEMIKQVRCSSNGLGKRYFRQQKLNKHGPPRLWKKIPWGVKGNNSRNGVHSVAVGHVANEFRGVGSDGVNGGGDNYGSAFSQHSQRPYQH
uniref:Histone-lysine N-methyltransferase ASHH2 n=1 Tax=Nelumbo nucifera TaxID=4432 RepID=A0A822ZDX7_NELNU|nr:TPA_asm: hypothetical protein HUJ06_014121 [Nelumbo nucifera]